MNASKWARKIVEPEPRRRGLGWRLLCWLGSTFVLVFVLGGIAIRMSGYSDVGPKSDRKRISALARDDVCEGVTLSYLHAGNGALPRVIYSARHPLKKLNFSNRRDTESMSTTHPIARRS